MALKITETVGVFGDKVELECYGKVVYVGGTKEQMTVIIENRRFDKREILVSKKTEVFTPLLVSSDNFIAQAYVYLKTLPEFADAIDC